MTNPSARVIADGHAHDCVAYAASLFRAGIEWDAIRAFIKSKVYEAIMDERARCAELMTEFAPAMKALKQAMVAGDFHEDAVDEVSEEELLAGIESLAPNVTVFPGITTQTGDPRLTLQAAMRGSLNEVVVVGWQDSGDLYFAASKPDGESVLWLLEVTKHELITVGIGGEPMDVTKPPRGAA